MKKLDLMIVGAQKAGTTSLNNYLRQHSDVCGHEIIEFSFFADGHEYKKGFPEVYSQYFDKKTCIKNVAKNVTLSFNENGLKRLEEHNPDIKIVLILREPVSRVYSAYTMAVKDGWMKRPFSEFNKLIKNKDFQDIMYRHFVGQGKYAEQIDMILKYFPASNLRIYLFEDLKHNPQNVCNDIFRWLNIEDQNITPEIHNPTFQPKSLKFTSFLNNLRSQKNPLKRLLKAILPYNLYRKLGKKVVGLNNSNKKFEPIPYETKEVLLEHFKPLNFEIRNVLEKHNGSDCIVSFSKNNWISDITA